MRVHKEHPDDFWAAFILARTVQEGPAPDAAFAPYQRCFNSGGTLAAIYNNLGLFGFAKKDWHAAYPDSKRPSKSIAISSRPITISAWP